jgi:hypothetical protein
VAILVPAHAVGETAADAESAAASPQHEQQPEQAAAANSPPPAAVSTNCPNNSTSSSSDKSKSGATNKSAKTPQVVFSHVSTSTELDKLKLCTEDFEATKHLFSNVRHPTKLYA